MENLLMSLSDEMIWDSLIISFVGIFLFSISVGRNAKNEIVAFVKGVITTAICWMIFFCFLSGDALFWTIISALIGFVAAIFAWIMLALSVMWD